MDNSGPPHIQRYYGLTTIANDGTDDSTVIPGLANNSFICWLTLCIQWILVDYQVGCYDLWDEYEKKREISANKLLREYSKVYSPTVTVWTLNILFYLI